MVVARPGLVADGMFMVGLDIIGDKRKEVNVFSPGELGTCAALYDENFSVAIVKDLERKLSISAHYPNKLTNLDLAAL